MDAAARAETSSRVTGPAPPSGPPDDEVDEDVDDEVDEDVDEDVEEDVDEALEDDPPGVQAASAAAATEARRAAWSFMGAEV